MENKLLMSIEVESLGIYTINAMQSKVNYWIVFSIGLEVLSHYNRFPPLPYNLSKRNNSFRFSIRTNWPKNGVFLFQLADRLLFIEFPSIMYVFKIIIGFFFVFFVYFVSKLETKGVQFKLWGILYFHSLSCWSDFCFHGRHKIGAWIFNGEKYLTVQQPIERESL